MKRLLATTRTLSFAIALLTALALPCLPRTALAAGVPVLGIADVTAEPGSTATVDVTITNNPGIIGATLTITYDAHLTLTSVTNGAAFAKLDMTVPGSLASPCRVHWDAADLADSDVRDGTVMTLAFSVAADAPVGTSCSVRVAAATTDNLTDIYDRELRSLVTVPARGAVTVAQTTPTTPHVSYSTHIQGIGWQNPVRDGALSGTSGQGRRLEAMRVSLEGASGSVVYRAHAQGYGWMGWVSDGRLAGTSGEGKRLEAVQVGLTGEVARYYDVWYRVHAQHEGWMGWARNGAMAGTAAHGWRLEAIEMRIVPKGGNAPGSASGAYLDAAGYLSGVPDEESGVLYRTHVQSIGWQNFMRDGEMAGTSGRSLRLEAIEMRLGGTLAGGVEYRTHVQSYGWMGWVSDGRLSGTSGESKRLEAVEIRLTGAAAATHDVWYRVHAQHFGWLGWARNGESSGTAGYAYRLEAIEVRVLPKGATPPGAAKGAFRQK